MKIDRNKLKQDILTHFANVGIFEDKINLTKDSIRKMHKIHRETSNNYILQHLHSKSNRLIDEIADGTEVEPTLIQPQLIEVKSGTYESDLFRFATLMWSVPVSKGYGRRMRYLVRDQNNRKLIGVFALCDPVFNMSCRDQWIGWKLDDRRERLVHLMNAYVVGSVPPYSMLLGGKLVTSLMSAKEVSDRFTCRYSNTTGVISGRKKQASLALITVTSALGRSSIYNRVKLLKDESVVVELKRLGTTLGYGNFHITPEIFDGLRQVLREEGHKYADSNKFSDGRNWRMRVARIGLEILGLDYKSMMNHGIKREVYAMPLATNFREFLLGKDNEAVIDNLVVNDISELALRRWVIPRSVRKPDYETFQKRTFWDEHINLPYQKSMI